MLLKMVLSLICCISFGPYYGLAATYDVTSYGAKGDGTTDDTQAFGKAWTDFCGDSSGSATLVIPSGKSFLLNPTTFLGPCKSSNPHVQLLGTIVAPSSASAWQPCVGAQKANWLVFGQVNGLIIDGSGTIDGQGTEWYSKGSTSTCIYPLTALLISNCNGVQLSSTNHVNSPGRHIAITGSQFVDVGHVSISAPADSPNTDGIGVSYSVHVNIHDSDIRTGDDCVAINGGCSDVNVTGVFCGPGHGLSIGSLGDNGAHENVDHINVMNCNMSNTQNGVRIKTTPGGSGLAQTILFEQIQMSNVQNPIVINQHYCNGKRCTLTDDEDDSSSSSVQLQDITYRNIQGTSATQVAISLDCSELAKCNGITMDQVTLSGSGLTSYCDNAEGTSFTATTPAVVCQ